MSIDLVLADLRRIYQIQAAQSDFCGVLSLTEDDIQRWSALIGATRSRLYDEVAIHLARGFNDSEQTFEFCDAVMNGVHGIISNADEERPELFWKVYLAFDEGEYYHGNNRQEDPVAAYTRPLVAQILADVSSR
jgi:hypothetical protein